MVMYDVRRDDREETVAVPMASVLSGITVTRGTSTAIRFENDFVIYTFE
jgi:hypothetical protein